MVKRMRWMNSDGAGGKTVLSDPGRQADAGAGAARVPAAREPLQVAGMQQSPGLSLSGRVLADEAELPKHWPAIVRALRNPNFRLFLSGNFLSNIGTWMQNVAQGWLVLTLTDSAFWLGVVGFAGAIPFLIFMLFGGVIADRVDKRRLLLVTQTVMMMLAFVLAGLTYFHHINVWGLALLAFLNGTAMAMNNPSYQAMVPKLVEREDLTNAIALNSAQFNMSRILGPTLGGYAMLIFGVAGNFFLNGLSFVAVLFALTRIRYPEEALVRHEGLLDSLISGFRYVRSIPQMYVLMWMIAISSFLSIPFLTFIPYFARDQLGVGESGLGLLLAASGTGAVLGAATVAWKGAMRHRGRIIAFCGAAVMAIVVVVCYSRSFALSESCMFFEGFGMILTISSVNVAMQHLSSDEMRGRVMSIYGTAFLGLPPLGALLAGEVSRHISTGHALALMSGVSSLAYVGFFVFSRPLRTLD
jgi:MFS family permease